MTTYSPTSVDQFTSKALNLVGKSIRLTATALSTTAADYHVPYDCIMDGGIFLSEGSTIADGVSIEVWDLDGVLGVPPGTMLLKPVDDWGVAPMLSLAIPYPAKLYAGLYIRLVYRNSQATEVKAVMNLPLHKVLF